MLNWRWVWGVRNGEEKSCDDGVGDGVDAGAGSAGGGVASFGCNSFTLSITIAGLKGQMPVFSKADLIVASLNAFLRISWII